MDDSDSCHPFEHHTDFLTHDPVPNPGRSILDLSLETFKKISLANYAVILDPFRSEFFRSVRNSLVIGTASTILTLAVASLSGYAFARFRFNGSYNLKTWILSMRFFPAVSIVVPLYLIWIDLGLTDTISPVWYWYMRS